MFVFSTLAVVSCGKDDDHDDHDGATDPAEDRLHQSIKRSFSSLGQSMKQGQDPRKSMAEANATVE